MKYISPLALRSVLLYHASLLQYARYVTASTSSSFTSSVARNASIQPQDVTATPSLCANCVVSIVQQTLTYPSDVTIETQTLTAIVIPYVTQYADGSLSTSYSTIDTTSAPFQEPSNSPLTWSTYGTALTYPTTYLAFLHPQAGFLQPSTIYNTSTCGVFSYTQVPISLAQQSHLIFPADTPATITQEVFGYLDSLPTLTAVLGGQDPHSCSQTIGRISIPFRSFTTTMAGTVTPSMTPLPVSHTSVSVLTKTGKPVSTRVTSLPDTNPPNFGGGGGGGQQLGGIIISALSSWEGSHPGGNGAGPTGQSIHVGPTDVPVANDPGGAVIVGGQTLAPGSTTVVNGVTISHPSAGGGIVVDGTSMIVTATSGGAAGTTTNSETPALQTSAASARFSISTFSMLLGVVLGVSGLWL